MNLFLRQQRGYFSTRAKTVKCSSETHDDAAAVGYSSKRLKWQKAGTFSNFFSSEMVPKVEARLTPAGQPAKLKTKVAKVAGNMWGVRTHQH